MIKNSQRYVRQVIDIEDFLRDTNNCYTLVSQRPYKGKTTDSGEVILAPGVNVTLQILEDHSETVYDKNGNPQDDNSLETFDATIVGCDYPLPLKKGTKVRLGEFLSEYSFYINYTLILRFSDIFSSDDV